MAAALSVELENVTKRFSRGGEDVAVLNGINLQIPPGDFVALMGPSGSGKSTLLNLIAGLDRPTSGRVKIGDREPGQMSDNELCDWRSHTVGFIFQKYHLLHVLTAAQNVEVPLLCFKMAKAERERRVKTALELVGLADRMNHYPRQLSGGQEQRVAIARSLVTDPSLLICDEPTGDLDAKAAAEVMQLLTLLNSQLKKTIVMVTHDPKAAQKARRVLSLEKGVIAARA